MADMWLFGLLKHCASLGLHSFIVSVSHYQFKVEQELRSESFSSTTRSKVVSYLDWFVTTGLRYVNLFRNIFA